MILKSPVFVCLLGWTILVKLILIEVNASFNRVSLDTDPKRRRNIGLTRSSRWWCDRECTWTRPAGRRPSPCSSSSLTGTTINLQCVERSLLPQAKISSIIHAQLLLRLHGKQQQIHTNYTRVSKNPWGFEKKTFSQIIYFQWLLIATS